MSTLLYSIGLVPVLVTILCSFAYKKESVMVDSRINYLILITTSICSFITLTGVQYMQFEFIYSPLATMIVNLFLYISITQDRITLGVNLKHYYMTFIVTSLTCLVMDIYLIISVNEFLYG